MGSSVHLRDWFPRLYITGQGPCLVKTIKWHDGSPVRVMQIGGVYQSATFLDERRYEPVFSYYRGFDLAFQFCGERARLLMIGGGGFAWPKHVLAGDWDAYCLDVVEIDPAVIRIARKHFYVDEASELRPGTLRCIEGDGRAYVEQYRGVRYDCIVLDAFSGCEPVESLATVEFAREAKCVLAAGGAVLANVVSADDGTDISFLSDMAASFSTAFETVYAMPCEDDPLAVEDNYLLVATDSDVVPDGAMVFDDEFLGTPIRDAEL